MAEASPKLKYALCIDKAPGLQVSMMLFRLLRVAHAQNYGLPHTSCAGYRYTRCPLGSEPRGVHLDERVYRYSVLTTYMSLGCVSRTKLLTVVRRWMA